MFMDGIVVPKQVTILGSFDHCVTVL